mmetsp:Transcript_74182/g.192714  ORF Transcript_74182/g.192714 Transcript_74182/m.192714 type:complete len:231 (-) Transcript_74182:97-789(-)
MRPVRLILVGVRELLLELDQEPLQDRNDAPRLELVGRRPLTPKPRGAATRCLLLQDGGVHARHARHGLRHLLQQGLGRRPVGPLRLKSVNRPLQGVHRLAVVLGDLQVLRVLLVADRLGVGPLGLQAGDLLVQLCDLMAKVDGVLFGLGDERHQLVDLAGAILDLVAQPLCLVIHPLCVLVEGFLLLLHHLLSLGFEVCHHLQDLLRRGRLPGGEETGPRDGRDEQQGQA